VGAELTLSFVELDVLKPEGGVVCCACIFSWPKQKKEGYTYHVCGYDGTGVRW
jgi:hypothetical protein